MLNDFSRQLSQYKENISGLSVADKLLYLEKNTKLSGMLNSDAKIKEAFVRLVEVAANFGTDLIGFFSSIALHTDTDVYAPTGRKSFIDDDACG
jgi:hypothetical protein